MAKARLYLQGMQKGGELYEIESKFIDGPECVITVLLITHTHSPNTASLYNDNILYSILHTCSTHTHTHCA